MNDSGSSTVVSNIRLRTGTFCDTGSHRANYGHGEAKEETNMDTLFQLWIARLGLDEEQVKTAQRIFAKMDWHKEFLMLLLVKAIKDGEVSLRDFNLETDE
jgi:hypothetical protein